LRLKRSYGNLAFFYREVAIAVSCAYWQAELLISTATSRQPAGIGLPAVAAPAPKNQHEKAPGYPLPSGLEVSKKGQCR